MGVVKSIHMSHIAVETFDPSPLEFLKHHRVEIDDQDLAKNIVAVAALDCNSISWRMELASRKQPRKTIEFASSCSATSAAESSPSAKPIFFSKRASCRWIS